MLILSREWVLAAWGVLALCLTSVGAVWVERLDDAKSMLDPNVIAQSAIGFALPMMIGIWIASEVRRWVGLRRGVRLDPLLPLALPMPITSGAGLLPFGIQGAAPIWPFGVFALLDPRPVDKTPFPDRSSLAWTAVSTPLVLFLIGALFEVIGLLSTPNHPKTIDAVPFQMHLNPIVAILVDLGIGDVASHRLQWVSPLALAGHGLSMLAWILLLPIPNFPGDHLISALFGPSRSLEMGQQSLLFAVMLLTAVWVFMRSGFWPWLLLVVIGAVRRFQPEAIPLPLVVDEWKPLEESEKSTLSVLFVLALLAGFPGWAPASAVDDWDASFSLEDSLPDRIEVSEGGHATYDALLSPTGVLPREGWIRLAFLDDSDGWSLEWTCGDDRMGDQGTCIFDGVSPQDPLPISIDVSTDGDAPIHSPVRLNVWLQSEGDAVNRTITVVPMVLPRFDNAWAVVEYDGSRLCSNLTLGVGDIGNLSLLDPGWDLIHTPSVVGPGLIEVCVESIATSRLPPPVVSLVRDNGSEVEMRAMGGRLNGTITSDGTMREGVDGVLPMSGEERLLLWLADGEVRCPPAANAPSVPSGANASWDLRIDPLVRLDGSEVNLTLPTSGRLATCNLYGHLLALHDLAPGPSIALLVDGDIVGHGGPWLAAKDTPTDGRFAVRNGGSDPIVVYGRISGDPSALNLTSGDLPVTVPANSTVELDVSLGWRIGTTVLLWSEAGSEGLTLNLVALCVDADCGVGAT